MDNVTRPEDLQRVIMLGILIAIQLILGKLGIGYKVIRIDFAFVPLFLMGKWYGPFWAGIASGVSDVIGATIINGTGFFPQFTISAVLGGVITGWLFYHHKVTWPRVIVYQLVIAVLINLIMNTYWVYMINMIPIKVLLVPRLIKELIMTPIQILIIHWIGNEHLVKRMSERLFG
ncbi:folate family ECF transporter S component [Acetilactobacillus jinshanensis]|nr:folate family ECF transporter S component [Acetilactobacillus jinshanensis]URL61101.1 folate family ECF transporter S component [uncultured bacterium]